MMPGQDRNVRPRQSGGGMPVGAGGPAAGQAGFKPGGHDAITAGLWCCARWSKCFGVLAGHPQPHGVCTQQVWMREAVHSCRSHSDNRPRPWSVLAAVACACAGVYVCGAGDWSSRFDAVSVVSSHHACSHSPHTPMTLTSCRCQATRAGLRLWWPPSSRLWRARRVWNATTRWYAPWARHGHAAAGRLPATAHAAGRPGPPTRRLQSVPSAAAVGSVGAWVWCSRAGLAGGTACRNGPVGLCRLHSVGVTPTATYWGCNLPWFCCSRDWGWQAVARLQDWPCGALSTACCGLTPVRPAVVVVRSVEGG
jgi:hypothetical protein